MQSRLEIVPGVGIGPVRLGMTPAEVLSALPEPRIWEEWMGGNLNDALCFHGLRLHFSQFDACEPLPEGALCWIVVQGREDAFLFDRPLVAWSREDLLQELAIRGLAFEELPNGEVEAPDRLHLSFDGDDRLCGVEI